MWQASGLVLDQAGQYDSPNYVLNFTPSKPDHLDYVETEILLNLLVLWW